MKYQVVIEGIDPEPERVYQSQGNYIEGCRIWAKSNLNAFEITPRYANAEAVIYENKRVEVERIKREPVVVLELKDDVAKIVEEIGRVTTSVKGDKGLTLVEVGRRLKEALEKIK